MTLLHARTMPARVATCIILAGIEVVLTFMWMSGNVGMIWPHN